MRQVARHVMTSMNVNLIMNVINKQNVITLLEVIRANVDKDTKEMGNNVEMLTNVNQTSSNANLMHSARIRLDLTSANVKKGL